MAMLRISSGAVLIILSVLHGLVDSIAFTGNPVSVDDDVRTNYPQRKNIPTYTLIG